MRFAPRGHRHLKTAFLILVGCVGVYGCLELISKAVIRSYLNDAAQMLGSGIRRGTEPGVRVNLLAGSAMVTGLSLEVSPRPTGALITHGTIDTLALSGLSYWALFRERISIGELRLRTTELHMDKLERRTSPERRPMRFSAFRVEQLDIRTGKLSFVQHGDSGLSVSVRSFLCAGGGVELRPSNDRNWSASAIGDRDLRFDSLAADIRGEQCVELELFDLDQQRSTLTIRRLHFGPYDDLEHFARTRPLEGDVADCRVDLFRIDGLHQPKGSEAPCLSARSVLIDNGEAHIFRDKTRPDGPSHITRLVARLLRDLPLGCGADSILLMNSAIIYNERGSADLGFGRIPFERMNAVVLGARNDGNDSARCTIRAKCLAFEQADVDFRFSTRIQDTTDRFTVEAHIGRMPFRALNGAFGPLLEVQAIQGRVDTIAFWMDADDRAAQGRVRLAYRDLRIVNGDVPTKKALTRPLSVIMNVLIKNEKQLGDVASTDERFAIQRGRDHSIFNYLWLGLREGSKKILLPKPLAK